MSNKILASGFMTDKVIVANVNNTFSQVLEFFTQHHIQHLPVADGDTLIGIISDTDMLSYMARELKTNALDFARLNMTFQIKNVMTPDPVSVAPEETIENILKILGEGKFQSVPVVKDGIIKGIITNKDLVRAYNWEKNHS